MTWSWVITAGLVGGFFAGLGFYWKHQLDRLNDHDAR